MKSVTTVMQTLGLMPGMIRKTLVKRSRKPEANALASGSADPLALATSTVQKQAPKDSDGRSIGEVEDDSDLINLDLALRDSEEKLAREGNLKATADIIKLIEKHSTIAPSDQRQDENYYIIPTSLNIHTSGEVAKLDVSTRPATKALNAEWRTVT